MRVLSGWGRTSPTSPTEILEPRDTDELVAAAARGSPTRNGLIARGLGRSYGDSAQNAGGTVIDTTHVTTATAQVGAEGVVRLSAGLSIDTLLRAVVPQGWFVPVTPGTRHVTVGGAIASDIHGKNHHVSGTFCQHVRSIRLALPTGEVANVSPGEDPELFWATAGGMGLTGVIIEAEVALAPIETSLLRVDTDRAPDLDAVLALMTEGDRDYPYSVAWIDLAARGRHLGRSVLGRGDFARLGDLPPKRRMEPLVYGPSTRITAPPVPFSVLNRMSVRAFNEIWYRKSPSRRRGELQSIPKFFHPLDMVGSWNRLYGPKGFLQWQPVVPLGEEDLLRRIVEGLAESGCASFLAVLKRFGPANRAPLSFPIEGWTLSLDIPADSPGVAELLDEMDRWVADAGGRVYLAKDSRLRAELVPVMYPRLDEWRAICQRADPDGVLQSDQARRLRLRPRPQSRLA